MRAPLSWLGEFAAELPRDAGRLADACNGIGLIVDAIDEPGREIEGVIVARILDVVAHPNADKLRLAEVDFGTGTTRVVCGAPNIEAGQLVPFAPSGASLPGGFRLERRTIRGEVSDGMLCSARELGLGDDHGGIVQLAADAELGADVRIVLGLDDLVLELEITPNRPDAMSIVGIARDLAAHFRIPFTIPLVAPSTRGPGVGGRATVSIEAPDRCPRYVGWTADVVVGPSPAWLARRLTMAGMRPINNVVDVTNYVMLERGQPLHAFDLARLPGRGIVVRLAGAGEGLTTLDGVERQLTVDDLLICDGHSKPTAVAGIMGGADSEVVDSTTELLLEAAFFSAPGIGLTSKRLGLRTDASARFERGVDPAGTLDAAARAMALLEIVASGSAGSDPLDAHPVPAERARVVVRTSRVNAVLGTALSTDEIVGRLEPLGIECLESSDPDVRTAVVPTFRPDIEREIDLIEEVGRHHGFNNITRTVPRPAGTSGGLTRAQQERRLVRHALTGVGASEAFTSSLVARIDLERCGFSSDGAVELENPLRAEESCLRTAVLPGLVRAVGYNASHGQPNVALFELGHVFGPPSAATAPLPDEREHVACVLAGLLRQRPHADDRPVDVHDATAALASVLDTLEIADVRIEAGPGPGLHPARSAAVVVDGAAVGWVGEVDPEVAARFGGGPIVGFECDLDRLLASRRRSRQFQPVSVFPASSIDLAFVVDDSVPARSVEDALRAGGGALVESIALFDAFRSEAVGAGNVSLAFSIWFRAPDRTLTDQDVAGLRQGAIDAVLAATGARLRG